MNLLLLKLLLVPSLIAAVTLAGRRWGPGVAGWLSAFPVVSAPILGFIAVDQGASFAAQAAAGTLSAVLAILVFGVSYAWAALRWPWTGSLALSYLLYFATVALLHRWAPSLAVASLAVVLALLAAPRLYPHPPAIQLARVPKGDIPWRMLAGALLMFAVTGFAAGLGPRLSGLFAMFPVMATVLVVFSHRHAGAVYAILLLQGMVLGYYAFAAFCLVLALSLPAAGLGAAFLAALAAAGLVQVLTRLFAQRQARVRSARAGDPGQAPTSA